MHRNRGDTCNGEDKPVYSPLQAAKERHLPAAKRRQAEARQDEDDFAAEYTLLRKLKRGRLSEVSCPVCCRQPCSAEMVWHA